MVRYKILRASALVATSVGLILSSGAGVASAASPSVISFTGPDSLNRILTEDRSSVLLDSRTNVFSLNATKQTALSGPAVQTENTWGGGSVESGQAANRNATSTQVQLMSQPPVMLPQSVSGSGNGVSSLDTTGPDSSNEILRRDNSSFVQKDTVNVGVVNLTEQTAVSGPAVSSRNTRGGDLVMSGDAWNSNTTATSIMLGQ